MKIDVVKVYKVRASRSNPSECFYVATDDKEKVMPLVKKHIEGLFCKSSIEIYNRLVRGMIAELGECEETRIYVDASREGEVGNSML